MRTRDRHRPTYGRLDRETPLLMFLAAVLLWIGLSMPGAHAPVLSEHGGQDVQHSVGPFQAGADCSWTDPLVLPDNKVAVERAGPTRKRPDPIQVTDTAITTADADRPSPHPHWFHAPVGTARPAVKGSGGIRTTGPPAGQSRRA